jgi:hypothetical protein
MEVSVITTYSILLLSLLATPYYGLSQGNLQVTPKRIVFDNGQRSQVINIANTGEDTLKYSASLVEIRMKEDGAFEQINIPDSGQNFASSYLRYYPKEFNLAPRESQTIRVELKRNAKLSNGEYRSHILFHAKTDDKPLESSGNKVNPANISVRLIPVYGLTIPVIIRVGEYNPKISISDMSLTMIGDTIPRLNVTFQRTGNMSVYGNIKIYYSGQDGIKKQIGIVNGLGIYVPTSKRNFSVDLDRTKSYRKGKLSVVYELIMAAKDKQTITAEKEISL